MPSLTSRPSLLSLPRSRRWPLILFIFALIIRAASMACTAQSPVFWAPASDEAEHWDLAMRLAAGDWLGREIGPYHRPQLFAYALALLIALFGPHFWIAHVFIGLCDAAAVVVWHAVARRAMGRGAAALAGLLAALYWPFVHFAGTGYMESFAMLLNALLLLGAAEWARRAARQGRILKDSENKRCRLGGLRYFALLCWPPLLLAGVMAGLSLLTRPQVLLLLPALAVWMAWSGWRVVRKQNCPGSPPGTAPPTLTSTACKVLIPPAAFLLIAGAVTAPNAVRHWTLFGMWAPLGTGSELNFAMSNNAEGLSWATTSPGVEFMAFQQTPFVEAGVAPEYQPTREFWARRNQEYLREHFPHFLAGYARKLLMMLNAYEIHCTQDFQLLREYSPLLRWLPGFGALAPFGFAGLSVVALGLFARRRGIRRNGDGSAAQRSARVLLAVWVVVYLLGVALFLAIARHRLPALPPLLLLAAWAMMRLAWLARRAPGRLGPWLAGLLLAVALTRLPVIPEEYPTHERWWSQVNVGVALMRLGEPDDAEAALREAAAILPEKPEGWRQLSLALAQQGKFAEAAAAQHTVVRLLEKLYPRHAGLHALELETAARLEAEGGDFAAAERTARRAASLAPGSSAAHNLLAYALLRQDRAREAIPAVLRALELDPANVAAQTNLRLAVKYLSDKGEAPELPASARALLE